MKLKVYIVNAFTEEKFGGNPAAIVPLKAWLSEKTMQQVAAQNNLSETAYIIPKGDDYEIRWFTPTVEVDLCGHATLASAHVLFSHLGYNREEIIFHSKSGPLGVTRSGSQYILDFPSKEPVETESDELIDKALGLRPRHLYKSAFDFMAVFENQAQVEALKPDFNILKNHESRGLIVTAKGDKSDFVSRCFYPQSGIDEDPVTGSAHVVMVPYWAKQTGKNSFTAIQLSARKGYLDCELSGDRVLIGGHALTYLEGEFYI
jgi:PhzF family phenazine biosynthesis protein